MKKLYILLVITVLLILSTVSVYADDSYDVEEYLEIINPSVEENQEVLIKNNLFISINIKKDAEMYLTIKKIIPIMDEIYINKIIDGELEKEDFINNIITKIIEINDDIEYNNQEIDKIKNIIRDYIESYIERKDLNKSILSLEKEIKINQDSDIKIGDQSDLIEKKEELKENYDLILKDFNENKEKYDDLFKVVILDNDPIKASGVVPYYEKIIKDIISGNYEIIIELVEEEEYYLLKKMEFDIKSKDEKKEESKKILDDQIKLIQPIKEDTLEE